MAQRYPGQTAHARMEQGFCPECGQQPESHSTSPLFWTRFPGDCDLLPAGVTERIEQYRADKEAGEEYLKPKVRGYEPLVVFVDEAAYIYPEEG